MGLESKKDAMIPPSDDEAAQKQRSHDGAALSSLQRIDTGEAAHPIHWSAWKKWLIISIYCALQTFITLTTTSFVSAEFLVKEQYGASSQIVALGQSMFIVGTAVGPAFLGPLSYVLPCS